MVSMLKIKHTNFQLYREYSARVIQINPQLTTNVWMQSNLTFFTSNNLRLQNYLLGKKEISCVLLVWAELS